MSGVPLAGLGSGVDARSALNIIYIMRNAISALVGFVGSAWQWLRLWLGSCFPVRSPDKDELGRTRSMVKIDAHDRIDLTSPWGGFGFQGGHMFTPMAWWSLILQHRPEMGAREWRLMMAEERAEVATRSVRSRQACATTKLGECYPGADDAMSWSFDRGRGSASASGASS